MCGCMWRKTNYLGFAGRRIIIVANVVRGGWWLGNGLMVMGLDGGFGY